MKCVKITKPYPILEAGCLVQEGYRDSIGHKGNYLGGRKQPTICAKVKVTQLLLNDDDTAIFGEWWTNILDYGYHPFEIVIPYFGVTKTYVARMINDLVEQPMDGDIRKIELDLILEA